MTKKINQIAEQVALLSEAIFKTAESHEQKLAFIKDELASNTLEINSQHIADKLLEFAYLFRVDIETVA